MDRLTLVTPMVRAAARQRRMPTVAEMRAVGLVIVLPEAVRVGDITSERAKVLVRDWYRQCGYPEELLIEKMSSRDYSRFNNIADFMLGDFQNEQPWAGMERLLRKVGQVVKDGKPRQR